MTKQASLCHTNPENRCFFYDMAQTSSTISLSFLKYFKHSEFFIIFYIWELFVLCVCVGGREREREKVFFNFY